MRAPISDFTGEPILYFPVERSENLTSCTRCGAWVVEARQDTHNKFHDEIDQQKEITK